MPYGFVNLPVSMVTRNLAAVIDFSALISELPGGALSLSGPVFDGADTVFTFSQDGGETLFFVVIFDDSPEQTGVRLLWPVN